LNPEAVLDFDSSAYFCTDPGAANWIQFEFGQEIEPAGYAMKSSSNASWECAPIGWRLDASGDGGVWDTIDDVIEDRRLAGDGETVVFEIARPFRSKAYRVFRITQRVSSNRQNSAFALAGFEMFGTVRKGLRLEGKPSPAATPPPPIVMYSSDDGDYDLTL
jgi:hypothetical protein